MGMKMVKEKDTIGVSWKGAWKIGTLGKVEEGKWLCRPLYSVIIFTKIVGSPTAIGVDPWLEARDAGLLLFVTSASCLRPLFISIQLSEASRYFPNTKGWRTSSHLPASSGTHGKRTDGMSMWRPFR